MSARFQYLPDFSRKDANHGTHVASRPRRHTLQSLAAWALVFWGLPALAADLWTSGITRSRSAEFATEALTNLPDDATRAAMPRMVQLLWTFDPASAPDTKEVRSLQGLILAIAQGQTKAPGTVRLVATGRAPEGAFWCLYAPENFKVSALVEELAGFDSADQALAVRLRNRLSWVERRDPNWTWLSATLREMGRK